ncbi:MAG: 1-acyl-sn-glycerol-3-phosphate acyltransferase [Flavipsychrobacter sp.]
MQIFFTPLYDFLKKRRPLFWVLFLSSFAIWGYFALQLKLDEDISKMLPNSKAIKAMNDVVSKTDAGEQVIFLMSFKDSTVVDPDELIVAANEFTNGLQEVNGALIDTIRLQPGDGYEETLVDIVGENLPLFLTEEDYLKIDSLALPGKIKETLESNRKILLSPASVFYKRLVAKDPIGISNIVWKKLGALRSGADYENYDGYIFYENQRKLTFFLKPTHKASETGANSKLFEGIDDYINNWNTSNPNIDIIYYGGPAVAAGNATQMRTDTIVTLSLTIVLLLLLTYYYFRRKRIPLLLLVPVLYGAVMGLGIVYLIQGHISIIALGAGAIIMGIAIDFSIHFLSHAKQANDIRSTVKELAQPLTIGSFTTIAAFLALQLVDTPILQDLGLFAAASLAGAAICTLIFMPHLPIGVSNKVIKPTVFDKLAQWQPEKNKWLILFIVVFTPVMLYYSGDVQFDSNMMNLNYLSPKLKKAEDEISKINPQALSSVFVIANAEEEEQALQKLETASGYLNEFYEKGWIKDISNPVSLLPSKATQQKRIARWKDYWSEERVNNIRAAIEPAAKEVGFSATAFSGFYQRLNTDYQPLQEKDEAVIKSLFPGGFSTNEAGVHALATLKVPKEYRSKLFEALGDNEEVIIADRQQGASQLVEILNSDFTNIAIYSSLIVFFALLIGYGRFELAIIAFLPMAISWVWILGLMSLLGLKFNIVNIVISSLIFGLGDDYTIFTMDGLIERYKTGEQKLQSVRAAVYISVTTVIIGLGVLLLAKHPALRSIALISVTGLVCVLFISQTLQPFLFNFFIQNRANKKFQPFTLWSFAKSVFAFTYFFTGSLLLTVLGVVFTKLWPFGKERGKYIFHICISKLTWSMMHIMANVTKRTYNIGKEDFQKPAVFIANHTSFLDILITTSMHPRIVLLTNKWVWRSPVFGAVVRMGEYYPVAEGAEDSLEPLKDLTDRGYSVLVFPEGTRSYDDKIKRFKKGAFFIAEKLQLDIVPVVLHGVHNTMQKGDFLLKDSLCATYIYDRITPDDTRFGATYSERAKYIGRWMRSEMSDIREKVETPSYFRERLIRSYTYKGPVLEWYCRVKISLEKNYEQFHELLPRTGKFYDLGCGYGFMTYMLHWAAPERQFVGVDYDDQKIEVAQGNYLRNDAVNFKQGDITQFNLEPCDGIIISDVLHYLLPEQQTAVLGNCLAVLNDGGQLIIRDGVSELKERIKGTKLTEVFSTKIFKFNKTQNNLHFLSQAMIEDFAQKHNLQLEILDNSQFTANLIFVLKK